jgi:ribonucleoside-diphosphate reductase beta chain
VIVAGYGHFLRIAELLQWDAAAVDLAADCDAWPKLDDASKGRVLGLIAGFCLGEAAVAGQLSPFQAAASSDRMAACFRAQAIDEQRHASFFDQVAGEVAGVPGGDPAVRADALRGLLGSEFVALFDERLPATAQRLADDREGLAYAVGLYHMVLEGVVFLAGQHALFEALDRLPVTLPGLRRGLELVLRDERWHIGFGARCLQDTRLSTGEIEGLLEEGQAAAEAWEQLVSPERVAAAALLHRRRLRAAGLIRQAVAA